MNRPLKWMALAGGLAGSLLATDARRAEACGCFTPPDPTVPVVQAGERIVFAAKDSEVVAHIQIQYAGEAKEFGWLLPLPSLPNLELGTDELFNQVTNTTQPKYRLTRIYPDRCGVQQLGFAGAENDSTRGGGPAPTSGKDASNPLVIQDSIGPYDYAVLKADSKQPMLDWLADNRYFVPAGTDDVVGPYINPGAFFLALKLRSGKSTGDLQPVVVRYKSDLPMIPIVLTSVAAKPNMGIQVWTAGTARAIPRNYYHTVINDAAIDWNSAGQNYNDVIIRAVNETKDHHTWVTEYAGTSDVMKKVLDPDGRFGIADELKLITDPVAYVRYLIDHGYPTVSQSQGGFGPQQITFTGALLAILQKYIPMPAALVAQNVTPSQYYAQLDYYLGSYRQQNPGQFAGLSFTYDPIAFTDELTIRVVGPTLAAAKLFTDFPYLTRLYTTLSPEDMNSDPVFSFNPDLPEVNNVHEATLTYHCNWQGNLDDAWLKTASGFIMNYPGGNPPATLPAMPATLRTEILRESGAPEVIVDNLRNINNSLGVGGCSLAPGTRSGGLTGLALLVGLGLFVARARRRHD